MYNVYWLAEQMHIYDIDIILNMPATNYDGWMAYYILKHKRQDEAAKDADARARAEAVAKQGGQF